MTQIRYNVAIERISAQEEELKTALADAEERLVAQLTQITQSERHAEVHNNGLDMLKSLDTLATNIWLRNHLKIYCEKNKVAMVFIL